MKRCSVFMITAASVRTSTQQDKGIVSVESKHLDRPQIETQFSYNDKIKVLFLSRCAEVTDRVRHWSKDSYEWLITFTRACAEVVGSFRRSSLSATAYRYHQHHTSDHSLNQYLRLTSHFIIAPIQGDDGTHAKLTIAVRLRHHRSPNVQNSLSSVIASLLLISLIFCSSLPEPSDPPLVYYSS